MSDLLYMLAQTTSTPTSAPSGAPPSGTEVLLKNFLPLILVFGVFMWIMSRGKNKERHRFEQMLANLKKGDKIQTIGGVLGTVVDVRDAEVIVKVDESSNTKIRFNRTAIKEVLAEMPPAETK